jgi:outer membrane protein assembly factor BamB
MITTCQFCNRILVCTAVFLCALASARAADWTQFRGPGGLGIADDKALPTKWDANTNIAWKVPIAGPGASSPIVVGDKIFLTCFTGYGLNKRAPGKIADLVMHLLCLKRADGSLIWDKEYRTKAELTGFDVPQVQWHGYTSATPCADADTVYTLFPGGEVTARSFDGTQKWTKNLGFRFTDWGAGTSPVLAGDLVIVMESAGDGVLVALNKKSGEEVWRQKEISSVWDTPLILKVGDHDEAIVNSRPTLLAFDPAKGTPLWNAKGINCYMCPSVVAADGVVYAVGGSEGLAVKAGGKDDVTKTNALWRVKKGGLVSSPVYSNGYLFWAHDTNGKVYCVDAKPGKLAYEAELTPTPEQIWASPIVGAGNIYYVSRNDGATYVVAAKPEFQLVSVNTLAGDGSTFNASPVASNGQLLIRSDRFLYCIGKK